MTHIPLMVQMLCYSEITKSEGEDRKGGFVMKGYDVQVGFMGYVDGEYILFASEAEYYEYMRS